MENSGEIGFVRAVSNCAARYEADDIKLLTPGYYLVVIYSGAKAAGASKIHYLGPFSTCSEATWLRTTASSLGIVQVASLFRVPVQHIQLSASPILASMPRAALPIANKLAQPDFSLPSRGYPTSKRKFENRSLNRRKRGCPAA